MIVMSLSLPKQHPLSILYWLIDFLVAFQNKRERDDLITHFMNAAAKEQRELSDVELRDIIVNFIVAGRDTTACGKW